MTATVEQKQHQCTVCEASFVSGAQLGGHVGSVHPNSNPRSGAWRPAVRTMFDEMPRRGERPGGSLKRDTDTWPGKA